ncbi:hypothetical protein PHYSODRAFT_499264 [Phytophthora sojae]|uniref:FAR1 domain-containing protein n=1 Tax=Phytophthora sojae (strain P6497) TaxID=1094619 RepID=G4ZIC0_PHYSP|nr:hypothetical protein PHYSODRAFT_499264 [Phytophthora sojae]EGZ19060.1 hypothetical protein PHYSODRAFT_499264 [Phytophthora sojae]|eukprot:XP_009528118.1 hypothetical protein PHYSODRAFT_499264 [Phytophthora sojae]
MFGIEPDSDSDDGALAEAISALDEADEELSPGGTDDSDYEENPLPFGTDPDASDEDDEDNDDEERESAAENDGDESEDADEDDKDWRGNEGNVEEEEGDVGSGDRADEVDSEEDDEGDEIRLVPEPKSHRSSHLRVKRVVPVWFYGFSTTFDSWDTFHTSFDDFQAQTFQQFSMRTSTSVFLRNKQILEKDKERKRAAKKARKPITLVPAEWVTYSKTLVCTHGQPFEPKGKGKRHHNNVRDTKCKARLNVRVAATFSGIWRLRVNATGKHNPDLNKHLWESYAENRTVKDPQLTEDVAVLHKAGANTHGILQYLRERTGKVLSLSV